MNTQTVLAITMGDPAGIGPEIALKALANNTLPFDCRVFVIGDVPVLGQASKWIGTPVNLYAMSSINDYQEGSINVLDMHQIAPRDFTVGEAGKQCGKAAYTYIIKAISLAKEGLVDAVVTNPINKTAFHMAGIDFPGHTEIFAHETQTEDYSMLFMLDSISVIFVTTHCSIRDALKRITKENVYAAICRLNDALKSIGFEEPYIGVSGLNPHAGENGLFGNEEERFLAPAIKQAQDEGIVVDGPLAPDTAFLMGFNGELDGIVSMLHDHGFVALKSRDFEHGVNITVGLPIIRTSVGHGTAFDIAGTGEASETSLLGAIYAAHRMSKKRKKAPA
jgi:4-hydroxythreonine-4-phosphate dehydrogenase